VGGRGYAGRQAYEDSDRQCRSRELRGGGQPLKNQRQGRLILVDERPAEVTLQEVAQVKHVLHGDGLVETKPDMDGFHLFWRQLPNGQVLISHEDRDRVARQTYDDEDDAGGPEDGGDHLQKALDYVRGQETARRTSVRCRPGEEDE